MLRIIFLLLLSNVLTGTQAAQQPTRNAQIILHFSNARRFLAEQKPDLAAREYEAVLAVSPDNLQAQANLGVILFFQNRCSQATVHLTRALELQPKLAKVQALLGVCQKREGKSQEATRNLEASLSSVKENNIRSLIESNLVDLYYAEGDLQQASHTAEDLLKSDPHNPDVLYMIYRIHTDIAGRARDALAAIAPDSGRMHQMMAEHFINDGDATDAITQYERALVSNPDLPGVRYELAEAILQDSHAAPALDKATVLLTKALAENPENAGAQAKLGEIAMLRNNPEKAERHFSRALALQNNELDALKGMADIAVHRGDNEEAAQFLLRAIQVDPMDDKLHYRLSRLYRSLNRKADSEHEMDIFMKIRDLNKKTDSVQQPMNPQ